MTGNNKHFKTAFWPLTTRLWIKAAPQDLRIAHSLTQLKAFHQHASANSLGRVTYLEAAVPKENRILHESTCLRSLKIHGRRWVQVNEPRAPLFPSFWSTSTRVLYSDLGVSSVWSQKTWHCTNNHILTGAHLTLKG